MAQALGKHPYQGGFRAPVLEAGQVWVSTNNPNFLLGFNALNGAEEDRMALKLPPSVSAPLIRADMAYIPGRGPHLQILNLKSRDKLKLVRQKSSLFRSSGLARATPLSTSQHGLHPKQPNGSGFRPGCSNRSTTLGHYPGRETAGLAPQLVMDKDYTSEAARVSMPLR